MILTPSKLFLFTALLTTGIWVSVLILKCLPTILISFSRFISRFQYPCIGIADMVQYTLILYYFAIGFCSIRISFNYAWKVSEDRTKSTLAAAPDKHMKDKEWLAVKFAIIWLITAIVLYFLRITDIGRFFNLLYPPLGNLLFISYNSLWYYILSRIVSWNEDEDSVHQTVMGTSPNETDRLLKI